MSKAQAIAQQLAELRATVHGFEQLLASVVGTRLTRDQLADRLKVHRNTIPRWMAEDVTFPRPDRHGKWLLSEVLEWEQRPKR